MRRPRAARSPHGPRASVRFPSASARASDSGSRTALKWAQSLVLPASYPNGLAPGYLTYQAFDTLQGLCSYLRGVVCTKAVLTGMGVGSQTASAASATVNYLMRDGASMLGGLFLASFAANSFGQNIKAWRLFADVTNDIGLTLELIAPLWAPGPFFVVGLMLSSVLKAWCGVAAGATKAAITQHFSLYPQDVADLAAKEGSQETVVSLLGMMLGMVLAEIQDTQLVWTLFAALTALHVWANYRAVKAVHLRVFNWERLQIVVDALGQSAKVLTPQEVSALESLWPQSPRVKVVFGPTPNLDFQIGLMRFDDVAIHVSRRSGGSIRELHVAATHNAEAQTVLEVCVFALTQWDRSQTSQAVADMLAAGWSADAALLGDVSDKRVVLEE